MVTCGYVTGQPKTVLIFKVEAEFCRIGGMMVPLRGSTYHAIGGADLLTSLGLSSSQPPMGQILLSFCFVLLFLQVSKLDKKMQRSPIPRSGSKNLNSYLWTPKKQT